MMTNWKEKPIGNYHSSDKNRRWYAERDRNIYLDRKAGIPTVKLVEKYGISQVAIQKICARERIKYERRDA